MKKVLSLSLAILVMIGCFVATQKDAHAYPTNYGKYSVDYVNDLNTKYRVLSNEEINKIDQNADATLDFVLMLMSRVHYSKEYPNSTNYPKNYIQYCSDNEIFDDYLDNYQVPLTRGAFAQILINAIKNRDMLEINVVDDGMIPDIEDDYYYKDAVYMSYRYGFFNGCDAKGTFDTEAPIKTSHVLVLTNRIFNPNLRTTVSLYKEQHIKDDAYPMTYNNNDGLNITINKERHYDSDCYVANIIMDNPAYIKTIYSDLNWTNYGCEASEFNKRINSIFMVNGDFRNAEFGEKLGIIRNRQIVNDKKFSNVLGMDLSGNLQKINESNAKNVLKNNIRDTWTFGPWLIENSRIVKNLNNEARAPRTFIGQINRDDNLIEYIIVVADGRSKTNAGLTMKQCADILKEKNCDIGYNLDGGGSSIMMFNGKVLNDPCYGERADIDYIYIK